MSKPSLGSSRRGPRAGKKERSTKVPLTLDEIKTRLQRTSRSNHLHQEKTKIDFSDVPELTDDELKSMKRSRPGRPPLGDEARKMISLKLDTKLLSDLKAEAKKDGKPYQSLIHEILKNHFRKNAA